MTRGPERRANALSKARIVEEAIAILDAEGEQALTFRALAERLATGSGAIYWHIADKSELLEAATNAVVSSALVAGDYVQAPKAAIRAIALELYDAVDAHPWAGGQFFRAPWQGTALQVSEAIGGRLLALGAPAHVRFNAWSTLLHYILGVAGQNAANARQAPRDVDRITFLMAVADRWRQTDPAAYPFMHEVAAQLPQHDDREQFLAGVDLILLGIESSL